MDQKNECVPRLVWEHEKEPPEGDITYLSGQHGYFRLRVGG